MRRRELFAIACAASIALGACGWDPTRPFERDAPQVKEAIAALDAGDATAATSTLAQYLSTGACEDGKIGTPEILKKRPNGAYDLGLSLFGIGESFGRRFGDEESEPPPGSPAAAKDDVDRQKRASEIECALRVVRAVAEDGAQPIELRSRARYLEGNLLFLGARYEEAVTAYDESLRLSPGMADAGDPVARDAAWNRAVALRRIEDKKDAGNDAAQDGGGDSGSDGGGGDGGGKDGGADAGGDSGDHGDRGDAGRDAGSGDSGEPDAAPPQPQPQNEDAGPPPPSKANQDERMLDMLENAPTVQQEAAKKNAQKRHARGGMADK